MDCIHTYLMWAVYTVVFPFIALLLLGGGFHIYNQKIKTDNRVQNDAKVSGERHVVIQCGNNSHVNLPMPENKSASGQFNDSAQERLTPVAIETRRKIKKRNGDQVDETIVKFFDNPGGNELANKHFSRNYQGTTLLSCQTSCVKFCLLAPTSEIAEKIREDGKNGRLEGVIMKLLKNSPIPHLDCEKLRIKVTNVTVSTRSAKDTNLTSDVGQEQQLVYQHNIPIPKLLHLKDLPMTWATLAKMAMRSWATLYNFVALVSNILTGHEVSDGDSKIFPTVEEFIVEVTFEVESNPTKEEPGQLSLKKHKRLSKTKHEERGTPKDFVNIRKEVESVDDVKTRVVLNSCGHGATTQCSPAEGKSCTASPCLRDEVVIPMYKSPGYSEASGKYMFYFCDSSTYSS
ncbi:uncharacterized protein [Branchiostoma lanceolatum]|uniref:uncharacterized protein n=1 Tax=Branchiostoma lanceolatum TaxID=7740 RepID=UPI0034520153